MGDMGEEQAHTRLHDCPRCQRRGTAVPGQTVKALLALSLRLLEHDEYLFCSTPHCPVVYFTPDGRQSFETAHLRERVYQKARDDDAVWVCYCFRHSAGEIVRASPAQQQRIVGDITAGIKAGQCACDLRNPQGTCCLGNVRSLIKRVAEHNRSEGVPHPPNNTPAPHIACGAGRPDAQALD